jgi:site-specific DNA recombinase
MKRAAIYCRVSTDKQEEKGTSLGSQEQACREYAAKHGFEVIESLVMLEQHTGAELFDRPKLTQIRAAVKAGEIDALIFYAVDRLSRINDHTGLIVTECDYHGVSLECVSEPFDNTPEGKLMKAFRGIMAEMEREKIRERTMRGKRAKAEAGRVPASGLDLYGYVKDREQGIRTIRENEAATVRRIYEWCADGVPIREIVRRLNAEGIPSPGARVAGKSGKWATSGLHRILRDETYKGDATAFRFKTSKVPGERSRRAVLLPYEQRIKLPEGVTPAIVTPELWDVVQHRLATNKGAQTRNVREPRLLRGVVNCERCGNPMVVEHVKGHVYYRCGSRHTLKGTCGAPMVRADKLEAWAWQRLSDMLDHPQNVMKMLKDAVASSPNTALHAERDAAVAALKKLDAKAAKLLDLLTSDDEALPMDVVASKLKAVQIERKAAAARADAAVAALASGEQQHVSVASFGKVLDQVKARLRNAGFDEQRLAVEALVEDVVAGKKQETWRLNLGVPVSLDGVLFHSSS